MAKEFSLYKYTVRESESLGRAMEAITDNHRGTVIVVDDKGVLRGVLADGDIRRGILRGATAMTPISKLMNMNPLNVTLSKKKSAEKIFEDRPEVNVLPVIDARNKVVEVIIRDPHRR